MPDWRPLIVRRKDGFPSIMGVLNVTPDSFFEDSRTNDISETIKIAEKMIQNGADWLDIGGESTRPGANPVSEEEEISRVIPVVRELRKQFPETGISVDTRRAKVAELSLNEGADMINDISALSDENMINVIKDSDCYICLMHMKGLPENMQNNPEYDDVIIEVKQKLNEKVKLLIDEGVNSKRIIVDPGIGFGKSLDHNLSLLKSGREIVPMNEVSLMWGVSRKSMFSELLGRKETRDRLAGTLGIAAMSKFKAVDIIRVHDVPEHADLFHAMSVLEDLNV
ncbi:MAG: dihydropteroate synthase [Euryarchaeota archaeon]|nr:dihydropteroate synthase [Euryarchaeota archaeon]|tara:strand:+ start:56953 stop:57798 length:846 start_codon:yes stop_codon:yes gene_type:complete